MAADASSSIVVFAEVSRRVKGLGFRVLVQSLGSKGFIVPLQQIEYGIYGTLIIM